MKIDLKIAAAVGLCTVLVGCAQEGDQPCIKPATTDAATLASMYDEIHAFVEDRSCATNADCAAIDVGAKACGGPQTFLIYSRSAVDESELQSKAEELAAYESRYNAEHCVVSDCSVPMPPHTECLDQICVDASQSP